MGVGNGRLRKKIADKEQEKYHAHVRPGTRIQGTIMLLGITKKILAKSYEGEKNSYKYQNLQKEFSLKTPLGVHLVIRICQHTFELLYLSL